MGLGGLPREQSLTGRTREPAVENWVAGTTRVRPINKKKRTCLYHEKDKDASTNHDGLHI